MIDIRPGLRAYLLADAGVAALVAARIYPLVLPQEQRLSSIVYQEVSARGDHHMQGPSGLSEPRFQFTGWAATADAAAAIGIAIKNAIDGFRGDLTWGGSPLSTVNVLGIFFDSWRDDYDSEAKLYARQSDYFVWFGER